ncbi:MAG: hypothetical protein ACTHN5_08285 [Phycisphaerae bacterium]
MPRNPLLPTFLLTLCLATAATRADTPATQPSSPGTLYEDPTANSSVTVTQILPNSSTSMMTFGAVKRIRVSNDILIIEWGTTATTLLPKQFVGSLTVNKRTDPTPAK